MSKTDFYNSVIQIPAVPLLEDKRADQLPMTVNPETLSRQERFFQAITMITNGVPPLKAWRESYGKTQEEVSKGIDVHVESYALLEEGEIELDDEDAFCLSFYYGIMPYNLQKPTDHAMSEPILKASLRVYDLLDDHSPMKEIAHLVLMDEALPARSIEQLQSRGRKLQGALNGGLVTTFIETLLLNDQLPLNHDIKPTDEFIFLARSRQKDLGVKCDSFSKSKAQVYKKYNEWGHRLYREVDDERFKWANVAKSLEQLRKTMGDENAANHYARNPQSIGLEQWPAVKKDDYIDENFRWVGSWKAAHKRHVEHFADYIKADTKYLRASMKHGSFSAQLEVLFQWTNVNADLVQKYNNRQEITAHPDFKHLKIRNDQRRPQLRLPKL